MSGAWLPLALLCAFSLATSDALTKRVLAGRNEYLILWLRLLLSLPPLLCLLPFVPAPPLEPGFWPAVLLCLPLEAVATVLYVKALKLSPLSLTLPFLALTPVFLLLVPFLLLGERLTAAGVAGILLIAAGSYVLNLAEVRRGLLAPLRAIAREPGSRCMIGVAVIYSLTATLGKQAIAASTPLFFGVVYTPLLALLLTPVVLRKAGGELTGAWRDGTLRAVLAPGLWYALVTVTHVLAMSLTQVAYMIAVKRTSLLFGVLYGHLLFREPGFRERPAGALLMLAGVGFIVAGG